MDWPAASVLLGSLGTVAVAIAKWLPRRSTEATHAPYVELAEIRARLDALERSHIQMRAEVRTDIKELGRTLHEWMAR
jgi:hypothetical protein